MYRSGLQGGNKWKICMEGRGQNSIGDGTKNTISKGTKRMVDTYVPTIKHFVIVKVEDGHRDTLSEHNSSLVSY